MKKIYFLDDDEDVLVYVEFLQSHGYQVKIHKFAEDLIFKLHKEDIPDLLITEMIIQNSAPSNRFGGKRYQFHANCASLLADELMDLQIRKIILTGWFEEKDPMYQEAKRDKRFIGSWHKPKNHFARKGITPRGLLRIIKRILKE